MEATDSTTTAVAATIGDFIRQRRTTLGMSQAELGRKLGTHQVWVSQRECGYTPVRSEDLPRLAEALQSDPDELRSRMGAEDQSNNHDAGGDELPAGVITKEVVQSEVLRWQVGERSIPIEELSREELLGALRSLFDANAGLRAVFDTATDEIAAMYEDKVRSLHHALAANIELAIRDAVRDKMDVILEAVMAEIERQRPNAVANQEPEVMNSEEEIGNGH